MGEGFISAINMTKYIALIADNFFQSNVEPLYKTDVSAKYFKFLSWLTQVRDMKGGARNEFHCGIDDPISVGGEFQF